MSHSFTIEAPGRLSALATDVHISMAVPVIGPHPQYHAFRAIWDTGATGTVITDQVVTRCGLTQITMKNVQGVGGSKLSEVYVVNVGLPNGVAFHNVNVTKGDLGNGGPDVLIGMDIIGAGDFAVTNKGGKTMFSYRYPSIDHIDFKKIPDTPQAISNKIGRNSPCECGSGKKYKHCCLK